MIQILDKKVLSSDGIHMLAGKVYVPEGDIKGLFHVVHGMVEHISRYDGFMRELAENGYLTFGYDNLGHGHTVNDKSELGFIAHENGSKMLVDDVALFGEEIKAEYGEGLPYYLLGHSMGSFIARLAAEQYDIQDKLIIMGTGGPNPAVNPGMALIKTIKKQRDIGIIVYSVFTLGELVHDAEKAALLAEIDILIDGRYIKELDDGRPYVGSSNQIIHYLSSRYTSIGKEYYTAGKRRAEIKLTETQVVLIGVPSQNVLKTWQDIKNKSGGMCNDF